MENLISDIQTQIELCKAQAQELVDEYWTVFKMNNRGRMNSGDLEHLGSIAPRIKVQKKPQKYRIVWSRFKKTKAGSSQKGWSELDITRPKKGYQRGTFKRAGATAWELDLIDHYEVKLNPIRNKIEVLTNARNAINALIRKDSKDGTSN